MIDYVTTGTSAYNRAQETGATVHDYDLDTSTLYMGAVTIDGKYPKDGGHFVDRNVEQVWYVAEGRGYLWIEDDDWVIEPRDMIVIPRGQRYRLEGTNLRIVVASYPRGYEFQPEHISEPME